MIRMKLFAKLCIYILPLFLQHVFSLFKPIPIHNFTLVPFTVQNKTSAQLSFSSDASKVAIKYFHQQQNTTYFQIYYINGTKICTNNSFTFSNHRLLAFQSSSGPITTNILNQSNNQYIPTVWNLGCKIQKQWTNISMDYFQALDISSDGVNKFISFKNLTHVQEYDFNSKKFITNYQPDDNFTYLKGQTGHFVNQDHSILVYLEVNQQKQYVLNGISTKNKQQIFSINQQIYAVMLVNNSTKILGLNIKSSDIYKYDFNGAAQLVILGDQQIQKRGNSRFCTKYNFFVVLGFQIITYQYFIQIYSTNPPADVHNLLLQSINLDKDKFGKIADLTCMNNSLGVLNTEGKFYIFQYEENGKNDEDGWWGYAAKVGIIVAGIVVVLIVGIFVVKKIKEKSNKNNQTSQNSNQSLLSRQKYKRSRQSNFFKPTKSLIRESIHIIDQNNDIQNNLVQQKIPNQPILIEQQQIASDQFLARLARRSMNRESIIEAKPKKQQFQHHNINNQVQNVNTNIKNQQNQKSKEIKQSVDQYDWNKKQDQFRKQIKFNSGQNHSNRSIKQPPYQEQQSTTFNQNNILLNYKKDCTQSRQIQKIQKIQNLEEEILNQTESHN